VCQAAALQLGQAEAAGLRGRDHVVELVELLSAYSPNPARTSCWPARSTSSETTTSHKSRLRRASLSRGDAVFRGVLRVPRAHVPSFLPK
jgi:hypothetical protein